ncbi:hypothetical protein [Flavobacterium sp. ABG]|uniref:hypothetical protein n=1 Tax=Flavobacterium sp. ABG TaxID=1423322 RepID=UPI000AF3B9A0|nr:hypothetical protein [Flavobacterium sp. ABG]
MPPIKKIIYSFLFLFSLSLIGQNNDSKKDYRIEIMTIEKKTKDTIIGSFFEIYSGNKRIKAECCTNFDGIDIFTLNPKDIVKNRIDIKVYGLKCKPYKKKFSIKDDLKTTIYLKYGKTDYNNPKEDFDRMYKKLKIQPEPIECGTVE